MKNKSTVRICEDYVVRDQEEVQKILKRVSDIISKSYIRPKKLAEYVGA